MIFNVRIETENAAFHGAGCPDIEHNCAGVSLQIADILRGIIARMESDYLRDAPSFERINDGNGNNVGTYSLISNENYWHPA